MKSIAHEEQAQLLDSRNWSPAMTDRYEALRAALAAGPTPGIRRTEVWHAHPLHVVSDDGSEWYFESHKLFAGSVLLGEIEYSTADNGGYPNVRNRVEAAANAALAAAADPETLRALLAERDALAAQVAKHERADAALSEALNTGDGVYRP